MKRNELPKNDQIDLTTLTEQTIVDELFRPVDAHLDTLKHMICKLKSDLGTDQNATE